MTSLAEVFEDLAPSPVLPTSTKRVKAIAAPVVAIEPPPKRFQLLSLADLKAMPRLQWLIHGVLPASGCGAVFGPSTAGKSFLTLDMAAALAEGADWFGHRVKSAHRVIYIALEGAAGFRLRVEAWEAANGRPFPAGVSFLFESFELAQLGDTLALATAIQEAGPAAVIIVDTLNRASPSADENSSADMGRILEGVRDLQLMTLSMVLLVHHSGKDASKGLRGHSSLFAALDAAIEVTRTDDRREWKVSKSKDGEDGEVHPFKLSVIDLGNDEEGDPISSCVVRSDLEEQASPKVRLPKGGNQRIVYDALGPVFRVSPSFGKAGAPPQRPCIRLDAAIAAARDRLTVSSDRRTERTRQAITGLITTGVMGCNEDWLWLI